ncbi:MAG: amino acid ABC transporter substrate-binding protein [Desulfobacterales bacterium]|nr:amino acid ABC transporter substrate-binding protein [Desulfobacterales bacterium]MCP4161864.1 amino acid ABC transporter substrate-binding protein [Deltaproteobacteria bacterium]
MKNRILALFLTVFLIISANCYAEKVIFTTFRIPLMVIDNKKGVFIELTHEIGKRAGVDYRIIVVSPKGAIHKFMAKKADILFPALDVNFPKGIKHIKSSELIYVKADYVFTKKGKRVLRTMGDLEGKRIGITLGYPYVFELISNNLIKIDVASSDVLNVRKLNAERFDAFVVEEKSGIKAFEQAGLKNQMQYDKRVPLSRQDVFYAFQSNKKGKMLSERISKALASMKKDGTFAKIMKKASSKK